MAQEFDVHPNRIRQWRDQRLEGAARVFGEPPNTTAEPAVDVKTLHARIGELTLESGFLSIALGPRRAVAECRKMIDPPAKLSISRQAIVLITQGSIYTQAVPGVG